MLLWALVRKSVALITDGRFSVVHVVFCGSPEAYDGGGIALVKMEISSIDAVKKHYQPQNF
jgi:dihydroxyacid dehydratase/phosphogluconate dehydratase